MSMSQNQGERRSLYDLFGMTAEAQARQQQEELARKRVNAAAGALAEQLLAERDMPEDLRTFARQANLEHWALMVWQSGYGAGLRAALRGKSEAP